MIANKKPQQKNEWQREFSLRLLEAMKIRGESAVTLAEKMGLAHSSIYGWLKKARPGLDNIAHAAKILSVNNQWLVSGEGEMTPNETPPPSAATNFTTQEAIDMESQVLGEIRARLIQFKRSRKPMRETYLDQIVSRLKEYDDWCEKHCESARDSLMEEARKRSDEA